MSNLIQFLKDNFKIICSTILVYQVILTIFFYSTENLVILAVVIVVFASYAIITTYKDDIINFFKK
ncbi:TPA: hypothetical protein IAA91_04455 [Candidatus Avacholeplasma faecigallinarum]|nr:hypothetical protein [Candidatus Avacholeplasma faecigallinarum]